MKCVAFAFSSEFGLPIEDLLIIVEEEEEV